MSGGGRAVIDVEEYTGQEAMDYLTERLTIAGATSLPDSATADLAEALGYLPLALSHAAAYMIDQQITCGQYLTLFTDRATRLAEIMPASADTERYGRQVDVTLLLAVDAAQAAEPRRAGTARPAPSRATGPGCTPRHILGQHPVTDYLAAHQPSAARASCTPRRGHRGRIRRPVTADQAYQAVRLLHRYALITHTPDAGARAVRIHALTARAARETTPGLTTAVHAAADAPLALWTDVDYATTDLVAALRANTTTLADIAGDLLWHPDRHPLLYVAGESLLRAGLHTSAVTYWLHLANWAERLLGVDHPDTIRIRAHLALSYGQAAKPECRRRSHWSTTDTPPGRAAVTPGPATACGPAPTPRSGR